MQYAARVDKAPSTGPSTKTKTIMVMDFMSWDECKRFIEDNDGWVPVKETMPEIKRFEKDREANPLISGLPRPLRLWVGSESRKFPNTTAYLEYHRAVEPKFKLWR